MIQINLEKKGNREGMDRNAKRRKRWAEDAEYRQKQLERMKKHSKKLREEKRAWCHKNPEKAKEYMKKYQHERYTNDAEYREMIREANRKNQARLRAEGKTWAIKNPEKAKAYRKEYYQRAEVRERIKHQRSDKVKP